MKTRLRILLIEDAATDAELIERELRAARLAFTLQRVETEPDFRKELDLRTPHLVLSDHGLPTFDGFRALAITRSLYPEIPFIFVSGSNDPNLVAHIYEAGATGYVFKHDLGDLPATIREALESRSSPWPLPLEIPDDPAQTEFDLQVSSDTYLPPSAAPAGRLTFCPECRRLRDEAQSETGMETYCVTHPETTVVREICAQCTHKLASL